MEKELLRDFLILWSTIDPIGTLSIFVGVTASMQPTVRNQIALRAVIFASGILLGFLFLGQMLLSAMGISLDAFQISGGIILFLFGVQMIFGDFVALSVKPEKHHSLAIYPLAIPSIASPGAILAVVLLTDNSIYGIEAQFVTIGLLVVVLSVTYLLMLAATPIHRIIGESGAQIAVRVMGILLAALAVEMVITALPGVWQDAVSAASSTSPPIRE